MNFANASIWRETIDKRGMKFPELIVEIIMNCAILFEFPLILFYNYRKELLISLNYTIFNYYKL